MPPSTILLDDFSSTESNRSSRVYENPIFSITANTAREVDSALNEIQEANRRGQYVVSVFNYELGLILQGLQLPDDAYPLLKAWVFDGYSPLSQREATTWLKKQWEFESNQSTINQDKLSGVCNISLSLDEKEFLIHLEKIKELITLGHTYQVNYTFRIEGQLYGTPLGLYLRLREKQPSSFGAFFQLDDFDLLSFSPEWFLANKNGLLKAKPMKGTLATRGFKPADLASDEKNRAENLMIVDLIRNDLARISQTGSVEVENLFDVEKVGEVFQMTSTVLSRLREETTLRKLLNATFPCGSVTGAPKKRTMEIIDSLESKRRRSYCGALGWFDPCSNDNDLGDFAMSVLIRTVEVNKKHQIKFGVGSGITIGSNNSEEWKECLLKSSFLVKLPCSVGLFETIKVFGCKLYRFEFHMRRLMRSAANFGIPYDRDQIEFFIKSKVEESCISSLEYKFRIQLNADGTLEERISKLESMGERVKIFWAKDLLGEQFMHINSFDPLLKHKTTARKLYDLCWRKAEVCGGFDGLFLNEKGEITEGGRSNVFIRIEGSLYTPPVKCGLLPGIMREIVLKDPAYSAHEAVLSAKDVREAEEIYLTNSLRGIFKVSLAPINN